MSVLPAPAPLEQPPGDPRAVLDLAVDLTAAARRLEDLAAEVGGAVARVPEWHGADADAAATRAAAVAGVASHTGEALRTAAARLAEHADRWQDVRRRVQALQGQQDDDFAVARVRVATPFDPAGWGHEATVLEDLVAAENGRRRAHADLLESLSDDAAATGHVLSAATAGIDGGTGSGSESHVLAHLLPALPGWAVDELAGRAQEAADAFGGAATLAEWERVAAAAMPYASDPRFAEALLGQLGVSGFTLLLDTVDHEDLGAGSEVALLMAVVLGAARPLPGGRRPADRVLAARYVDPDDPSGLPDDIARGMAVIATAGAARGVGPAPAVLASWGRQMLQREEARGPLSDRLRSLADDGADGDPLQVFLGAVGRSASADAAVAILGSRHDWAHLLARSWPDGGTALASAAGLVGRVPGAAGEAALRSALEALGNGLEDRGDPDGWTVDRDVAGTVAPALGGALADRADVLTGLLEVGVHGHATERTALVGMAYLSLAPEATAAISAALDEWRAVRPGAVAPVGVASVGVEVLLPAIAVPSAFVAVRDHGRRLDHVLETHDRKASAERRASMWNGTVGLAVKLSAFSRVPFVGSVLGSLEDVAARSLGVDGRWEAVTDDGLRLGAAVAAAESVVALGVDDPAVVEAVIHQAASAYLRTGDVLGGTKPPRPSDETLSERLRNTDGGPHRTAPR